MHCHGISQTKEERKRERERPHAFSILLQSPGDYSLWEVAMKAMGARGASLMRAPNLTALFLINLVLLTFSSCLVVSFASPESDTLLKFKESLSNADALKNWEPSTDPCSGNWIGVGCSNSNDVISTLQLENMNLGGKIDVDSLVPLKQLRTLNFMNNKFEGPIPEIKKIVDLKFLFLSNNQFSGQIPDDAFAGMENLKKVYLSNNKFSGSIPSSLAALSKLQELRLEDNHFEGQVPDFRQQELKLLNVSNNELDMISGNKAAKTPPGPPGGTKTPATPAATKTPAADKAGKGADASKSAGGAASKAAGAAKNKKSPMSTIIIVIVVIVVVVIVVIVVMRMNKSKKEKEEQPAAVPPTEQRSVAAPTAADANRAELGEASSDKTGSSRGGSRRGESGKLSFVRDDHEKFELQDLLKASAEVLCSNNFGSSYKALLNTGKAMVVKRFKQMNDIEREEFYEHMRRLGRLTHPNLLPLVAYYYRKEEKLLVYDYVHNRSLANQLHGNPHVEQVKLDWPKRLHIVKGVAKALSYLHTELPSLSLPHGHLKSSNVLLNESLQPLLTDYTLVPMVSLEKAQQIMVAYKSPEYVQHGRGTKKTDVWCLGIVILETLTGKSPSEYLKDGAKVGNLSSWINSIKEDVDEKMGDTSNAKGEIQKLLKIGKACCEENAEKRLDLKEAVEKIEGIKEKDSTDKGQPDAPKVKEQSDAAKAKDTTDKAQSDAAKAKDSTDKGQSDAPKAKDSTDKGQSDAPKVKEQSDAAKAKDQSDAVKVKEQSDAVKVKEQSDAAKVKEQSDVAKVDVKG